MTDFSEALAFPTEVLVVDDEDTVLEVVTNLLRPRGMPVTAVHTGEEAVSALGNANFGCALIDKNLPEIDGLEVLRIARNLQPHCACIMITGYASVASVVEALRLGAADYIEKPFPSLEIIAEKIEMAMRNQRNNWERSALLERLQTFQEELGKKDELVLSQQTEIDMFNSLLELRVKEATEDLRKQNAVLEKSLHSTKDLATAFMDQSALLLAFVRSVQIKDETSVGMARGVLTRVARQLASLITLVKNAQHSNPKA